MFWTRGNIVELIEKVDLQEVQSIIGQCDQYVPITTHHFHAGMYCREVFREAGVIVIGAVHKKEHMYLIVSGTVIINDGSGELQEVTGPYLFKSKPGTKRAVLAKTDTTCMTFHVTDLTDLEELEKELIEQDPASKYVAGNIVKKEVLV